MPVYCVRAVLESAQPAIFQERAEWLLFLLEWTLQIEEPWETERDDLIQFYEMAFELAWKLMKDYLAKDGLTVKSPRQVTKQAFQSELIADGQVWIDALQDRNLTVHIYNESIALQVIADVIDEYYPVMRQFYNERKPCL